MTKRPIRRWPRHTIQPTEAGAVAWLSGVSARAAARREAVLESDVEREKVGDRVYGIVMLVLFLAGLIALHRCAYPRR